jgi:hypothetical protein
VGEKNGRGKGREKGRNWNEFDENSTSFPCHAVVLSTTPLSPWMHTQWSLIKMKIYHF